MFGAVDDAAAATAATAVTPIKTLIFFDLETTGLPAYECNRTKITELAMVACSVAHIVDHAAARAKAATTASRTATGSPSMTDGLPRVLHKLTLCVNPQRMIQPEATNITGLDNEQLEFEQPFDAHCGALLLHFVQQLPQPVCLVAHNGDKFDFPLLRAQLDRVGVVSV